MRRTFCLGVLAPFLLGLSALAAEPASDTPKPIPVARPEIKQRLEELKHRQPRLPLPELTEEERAGGEIRSIVNNGRARQYYLPAAWSGGGGGNNRTSDPAMTLDAVTRVETFWVVCRGNNCHYCLGHQELGLASRGLSDDQIAALDVDWSQFNRREQLAFTLARKMTQTPHAMQDSDVEALREEYKDKQIVELVYTIARFNSTNRWTDSLGLPQEMARPNRAVAFDQPTSEQFQDYVSIATPDVNARRPELESRSDVEAALSACRQRTPRVAFAGDEAVRAIAPEGTAGPLPQWAQAMAYFPATGASQVLSYAALCNEGRLPNDVKAKIAFVSARHNRSWYAVGHALDRLAALGISADAAFALTDDGEQLPAAEREALRFAAKLTLTAYAMTDADIARLRELYSDHEVAEIVYATCAANSFDRFTETLNLPLEAETAVASN